MQQRFQDELKVKRKWSNVREYKPHQTKFNELWKVQPSIPPKGTKNLVTKKVLDLDKKTCDYLLRKIYDEMSGKDFKAEMFQRARQEHRSRLISRHNQTMELEQKCGVRLGMTSKPHGRNQVQVGAESIVNDSINDISK